MTLDKERIYGYAKAYLESVTNLLKDKAEEAESDFYIGDKNLLRSALNQVAQMIRSEKLYRYAAEFIEGELKTIDRALMRTDSEERRDELQKRQHELICDLEDMEKQGYIGKSLEQVKKVKKDERRRRHAELRT